eukprot:Hpha_TRINITY_DN10676_c0_g1::TRINITY_DN10676_c0_g1_i1::g.156592::m.156592
MPTSLSPERRAADVVAELRAGLHRKVPPGRQAHAQDAMAGTAAKVESLELVVSRLQAGMDRLARDGEQKQQELSAAQQRITALEAWRAHTPSLADADPRSQARQGHQVMNAVTLELFFQQTREFMDEVEVQMRQLRDLQQQDRARTEQQVAALSDAIERAVAEQQHNANTARSASAAVLTELHAAFLPAADMGLSPRRSGVVPGLSERAGQVAAAVRDGVVAYVAGAVGDLRRELDRNPHQMQAQAAAQQRCDKLEQVSAAQHAAGEVAQRQLDDHQAAIKTLQAALQRAHVSVTDLGAAQAAQGESLRTTQHQLRGATEHVVAAAEARLSEMCNTNRRETQELAQRLDAACNSMRRDVAEEASEQVRVLEAKVESELGELASQLATLEDAWRADDPAERLAAVDAKLERELTEVSAKLSTSHAGLVDLERRVADRARRVDDYLTQLDEGLRHLESSVDQGGFSARRRAGSGSPRVGDEGVRRFCERRLEETEKKLSGVEEEAKAKVATLQIETATAISKLQKLFDEEHSAASRQAEQHNAAARAQLVEVQAEVDAVHSRLQKQVEEAVQRTERELSEASRARESAVRLTDRLQEQVSAEAAKTAGVRAIAEQAQTAAARAEELSKGPRGEGSDLAEVQRAVKRVAEDLAAVDVAGARSARELGKRVDEQQSQTSEAARRAAEAESRLADLERRLQTRASGLETRLEEMDTSQGEAERRTVARVKEAERKTSELEEQVRDQLRLLSRKMDESDAEAAEREQRTLTEAAKRATAQIEQLQERATELEKAVVDHERALGTQGEVADRVTELESAVVDQERRNTSTKHEVEERVTALEVAVDSRGEARAEELRRHVQETGLKLETSLSGKLVRLEGQATEVGETAAATERRMLARIDQAEGRIEELENQLVEAERRAQGRYKDTEDVVAQTDARVTRRADLLEDRLTEVEASVAEVERGLGGKLAGLEESGKDLENALRDRQEAEDAMSPRASRSQLGSLARQIQEHSATRFTDLQARVEELAARLDSVDAASPRASSSQVTALRTKLGEMAKAEELTSPRASASRLAAMEQHAAEIQGRLDEINPDAFGSPRASNRRVNAVEQKLEQKLNALEEGSTSQMGALQQRLEAARAEAAAGSPRASRSQIDDLQRRFDMLEAANPGSPRASASQVRGLRERIEVVGSGSPRASRAQLDALEQRLNAVEEGPGSPLASLSRVKTLEQRLAEARDAADKGSPRASQRLLSEEMDRLHQRIDEVEPGSPRASARQVRTLQQRLEEAVLKGSPAPSPQRVRTLEERLVALEQQGDLSTSLHEVEAALRGVVSSVTRTDSGLKEAATRLRTLDAELAELRNQSGVSRGSGGQQLASRAVELDVGDLREGIARVQADVETMRGMCQRRREESRDETAAAASESAESAQLLRSRIASAEGAVRELRGWMEATQALRDELLDSVHRRVGALEGIPTVQSLRFTSVKVPRAQVSPAVSPRSPRSLPPPPASPRHKPSGLPGPLVHSRDRSPRRKPRDIQIHADTGRLWSPRPQGVGNVLTTEDFVRDLLS